MSLLSVAQTGTVSGIVLKEDCDKIPNVGIIATGEGKSVITSAD